MESLIVFIIITGILLTPVLISAQLDVGSPIETESPNVAIITSEVPTNFSLQNVNHSNSTDFWDNLDTPDDFLLSMFDGTNWIDEDLDLNGQDIVDVDTITATTGYFDNAVIDVLYVLDWSNLTDVLGNDFVPYSNANNNTDLGIYNLTTDTGYFGSLNLSGISISSWSSVNLSTDVSGYMTNSTLLDLFLLQNGSKPLTANWNFGDFRVNGTMINLSTLTVGKMGVNRGVINVNDSLGNEIIIGDTFGGAININTLHSGTSAISFKTVGGTGMFATNTYLWDIGAGNLQASWDEKLRFAGTHAMILAEGGRQGSLLLGGDSSDTGVKENITIDLGGVANQVTFSSETGVDKYVFNGSMKVLGDLNQTKGNATINMIYGEMHFHNDTVLNVTPLAEDVWAVARAFGQEYKGNFLNGFSQAANFTSLTSQVAGIYKVDFSITGFGTVNNKYHFAVARNSTIQFNIETHDRISTGSDVISSAGTGMMYLSDFDNVTLMIMNEDGGGDFSVASVNINLVRVGN